METAVNIDATRSVVVLPDIDALSGESADLFALLARTSIAAHGRFTAALSGGRTPRRFYELLGSDRIGGSITWDRVHLFWADERIVPPDHPDSNFRLALESFLCSVNLSSENIHRIKGEKDAETAANEYDRELRAFFGTPLPAFDLVVLGVGEDGHTASLFPGSGALRERNRTAVPLHREDPDHDRVTLTLPVLNNAHHVLFLASGAAKAGVLHEIIDEQNRKGHPAGMVCPRSGEVRWLIDAAAAAKLSTIESGKGGESG